MDKGSAVSWQIKSKDPKAAINEYRGMLNDLTRLISDWVWETDTDFRLTYVSEKILQSLGIPVDDALGKKITQFGTFRSVSGETIHPDLTRPFRDLAFEAENRAGEIRSILISGVPVFDSQTGDFSGVRGISRDITTDKANKEASEKLGYAMESYPGYFFLTDPGDRIVSVNRHFRTINQTANSASLMGMQFEDHLRSIVARGLVPDAVGKEEEWITYRMYLHRNPHGSFEVRHHEGVILQITEIKLDDGSTATFSTDISELKRVEDALRQSAERNRIFAMNVGHDLRTPLAVLSANIDNMEDKVTAASLRRDLAAMSRSVEQLLDATRWEKPTIGHNDRVDLSKVARDVVSDLAMNAIRAGRHLELKGADLPVWVSGLEEPMAIAFRNLVENAIQYVPKNTDVIVEVDKSGAVLVIDMGPGIPENIKQGLDNPQIRFDRRRPNSGLGLSIVQRIAEAHGTHLDIVDKEGGGTVCRLEFALIESP
ncbi:MAG: PAS domain-containing protein [Rhodospirillales bacterium]|nr:PAS domain-containing protein [Rhodospirillales bacterium]